MSGSLNIGGSIHNDDSITSIQYHTYNPYVQSFDYNDEIRIPIQQQDLFLLLSESFISVEIASEQPPMAPNEQRAHLINFHLGFLFDEIRYELNGVEVDRNKNVGITTLMKTYTSFKDANLNYLTPSSFIKFETAEVPAQYRLQIPLRMVLGFAEDYNKIIMNSKHELILIRSRTDVNALYGPVENVRFKIMKLNWVIPHVQVSDRAKLMLFKHIDKNRPIHIPFRSWELYEYPSLPVTNKHMWAIKTSNQLNKPRYVIVGFQTNAKNNIAKDCSTFDHCNITNIKLHLNAETFPYENMNLDFNANWFITAYTMFCKFRASYYHNNEESDTPEPLVSYTEFKEKTPLYVFDCSRQNESLKSSMVDIRLEMEANTQFPPETTAFCLIIHDNIISYNPYTSIVNRLI